MENQIRHSGNFITHDLSDLNDITYKKGVFISQVNRLNARFPFVSCRQRSPIINLLLLLLWVPDLGFTWEACQTDKCRMEQDSAENFKSAIQNSSAVATFDSQWKIVQKSALQPSSQICKWIFRRKIYMFLSLVLKLKRGWRDHLGPPSCHERPCSIQPFGWAHVCTCGDDK